jgi:hypothetical protein
VRDLLLRAKDLFVEAMVASRAWRAMPPREGALRIEENFGGVERLPRDRIYLVAGPASPSPLCRSASPGLPGPGLFFWRCPMFWRRWARKDLRTGDLTALRELTDDTRWGASEPARLERLRRRGFIKGHEGDNLRVTMKGRVALLLGHHS